MRADDFRIITRHWHSYVYGGKCKFPTANSPTSSPRIRRLPHREFPTANSPTYRYRWRMSIGEFAENPWRMFAKSFVFSANIIHREFGELKSCEFVANIHHVSFKWTVLYLWLWHSLIAECIQYYEHMQIHVYRPMLTHAFYLINTS